MNRRDLLPALLTLLAAASCRDPEEPACDVDGVSLERESFLKSGEDGGLVIDDENMAARHADKLAPACTIHTTP